MTVHPPARARLPAHGAGNAYPAGASGHAESAFASDAPGFSKVKVEPHLGTLTKVSGTIPHPAGMITTSYELKNGKWSIDIILPQKITGRLIWKEKEYQLKSGENNFELQ